MKPTLFHISLLCLALTGCAHQGFGAHHHRHHHGGRGIVLGLGLLAMIVTEAGRPSSSSSAEYYVSSASFGPPMPPSPRDRPVEKALAPFDPQAARVALHDVDVAECRDGETAAGFGHAKVTFDPGGYISKVVVDAPSSLSQSVARCVGEHIGAATVRPFLGGPVVMGVSFRLP